MDIWQPAYVGVGSNLSDPQSQVLAAIAKLATLPLTRVVLISPRYASHPMGSVVQPEFVNAVVALLTQLGAPELLDALRGLERAFGRPERREKWGPRIIDLDILVYGRERRSDPELTLPHPGIAGRNFVLYPLGDIAPDLDIPGLGRVSQLRSRVPAEGLRLLSDTESASRST